MDGVGAFCFDVEGALFLFLSAIEGFWRFRIVGIPTELPSSSQAVVHYTAGQTTGMPRVHVLLCQVVDDVAGLGRCEQRCTCAVSEESKVAIICDDVDRCVPARLRRSVAAGTDVVHGTNIAAIEAKAGSHLEHTFIAGVPVRKCEGFENGLRGVESEGREICGQVFIEVTDRYREQIAGYGAGPIVVHASEPDLLPKAYSFPDAVFGCH